MDKLLKVWGIQFDGGKVVSDMNYKVKMMGRNNQPEDAPAFLDITGPGVNKDDVATSEIEDIWYALGGVFTGTPVSGLKETVLLKSTKDSQLVDGMMASFSGDNIMKDFKPSGTEYALAIRLTGKFKTAFPDGAPKETDTNAPAAPVGEALKEAKDDGTVVLLGDSDMLYDQFAVAPAPDHFRPHGIRARQRQFDSRPKPRGPAWPAIPNFSHRPQPGFASDRPFTRIKDDGSQGAGGRYQARINRIRAKPPRKHSKK